MGSNADGNTHSASSVWGEYAASLEGVKAAAKRIQDHIHTTPIMTCSAIDSLAGRQVYFKCEIFQRTGAFKFRGACNAVQLLSEDQASKGVATHSSGNHGQALALAAHLRKIPAFIVVPRDTPKCKLDAIASHNARITLSDRDMESREAALATVVCETGAHVVLPFNFTPVIEGQGTIALELLQQVKGLDAAIVPVSGGGMISGIATVVKAMCPAMLVIAAEPKGKNDAADVARCHAAGEIVRLPQPDTIADGLRGRLGSLTWPIVRDKVDAVITVSETEIVAAMRLCFERMKVVVEPSGAVGLAAAMSPQLQTAAFKDCKRVGIILCGGNVDLGDDIWQRWLQ